MCPLINSRLAAGRTAILAAVLVGWPAFVSPPGGVADAQPAPEPPAPCLVTGVVTAGTAPLPGVSVTAAASDGTAPKATSTGPDGAYRLTLASPGTYQVTLDLPGFAPIVRELALPAGGCPSTLDATLMLASRVPAPVPAQAGANGPQAVPTPFRPAGAAGGQRARGMPAGASVASAGDDQSTDSATRVLLPPGFSPDAATESVATSGTSGQTNEPLLFGNGPGGRVFVDGMGGPAGGPQDGPGGPVAQAVPGGPGGAFGGGMPGRGLAGGPGGPGGFGPGGFGRGMGGANRVRLTAFYTLGGSPLDAAPYPLASSATQKPDYLSQRFGVVAGGPLGIPGLFDKTKTSFFLNYTGNHSSNAYDSYSTVPTLAERGGDLSAFSTQIFDPASGQPFQGNQIPASRISPTAAALLNLFPLPNLPGTTQNLHFATTSGTSQDDINFRLIRNFGSTSFGSMGGMRGLAMGVGRGGPAASSGIKNLSIGVHYHRSVADTPNPFQALGSTIEAHAWDIPVNYAFSAWGMMNIAHARYNRSTSQAFGNFAFTSDIAGNAGIGGASSDPFDWSAPSVMFSSFTSLRDTSPSQRLAQTIEAGDTMIKLKGRHAIRFGGDYRAYLTDSRSDRNAAGTFVFTGLYTANPADARPLAGSGLDFADFLLGMPQQATVQYGPGTERFRGRSWDLFLQDDWRIASNVTLNLGARYEFVSPFREAGNRLVTLDVNPTFTAAVPVAAGGVGAFSGPLPSTLIKPDYGDIAPRVGVAWRAREKTVVRAGYGINYNAGVYATIAQQLAGQPPFAVAATNLGTTLVPLSFSNALLAVGPTTTSNTFAIDPNYRLGYVQIWNADVQRSLSRTLLFDVAYIGTRGANLDLQRAPNRGPDGLRIPDVLPFIFETSQATSTMNAVSVRLQKRLSSGFSGSIAYTYSRSFDDASTIGGGTAVVAQNDQNLAAEWGPSSFDQPHRFTGAFTYELPFGRTKRWLNGDGAASQLLGGWQLAGNVSIASGLPFTARVVGALADVANGVNGTLRADYTGLPIVLADPTVAEWFNTAAFAVPPAGQFGNAGRNSIRGPATEDVDLALAKDIRLGGDRGLNIRLQATNVLNTPRFSVIDTVVNSPTFGRVIGVLPMRTMQVVMRFRF